MSTATKAPTLTSQGRAAAKKKLAKHFKAANHAVFNEEVPGGVHLVSFKLMGDDGKLADKLKVVGAIVVFGPEDEAMRDAALAFSYGEDAVNSVLPEHRSEFYIKARTEAVNSHRSKILLLRARMSGCDLTGSVATTLLTGGGSSLCTIYQMNYGSHMGAASPRVMAMSERVTRDSGSVIVQSLGLLNAGFVAKVLSSVRDRESARSTLAYADVFVLVGLGLGHSENFQPGRQLGAECRARVRQYKSAAAHPTSRWGRPSRPSSRCCISPSAFSHVTQHSVDCHRLVHRQ
ncbi:electron transfer flavoprotein subunit alpha [Bradyrhizobium sp. BWA-3-5]|uniref:electron transfer flavoprotein subunit alpha n=1 Tax=Bradyrhizobium sp. BWA-3-5 TaxID=3080013 RepID=UPI00293E8CC8|nr:electron transfer flavoprotein subunit alpha [Bradyrhizobium sp. BWA-3-5]WOH63827.1 electron transfer flavoprotein subunit alpha [Bradyrhizobium sp. BWA-3-5]